MHTIHCHREELYEQIRRVGGDGLADYMTASWPGGDWSNA
jgi:hypothetical protein